MYLALGFVWGCSFIFIKLGNNFLTPAGVAFVRCLLGAIALNIFILIRKKRIIKNLKTIFIIWIVALLLNVIPGILFSLGEQKTTSIVAGIINACTPLATAIITMIAFPKLAFKPKQIIGILIGALGVLTILGVWKGVGHNSIVGATQLLLAVTCYGLAFPIIQKFITPLKLDIESLATTQLSLATITLLPFFLFHGISTYDIQFSWIMAMLALGILGSGFAYIWNFRVINSAGIAIASSVTYLTPVVAVFVGWIFLKESLVWHEPLGALIILIGAAISQNKIRFKRGDKD